jgi:two-component system, OmpR family, sensor histidine kinase SaeS
VETEAGELIGILCLFSEYPDFPFPEDMTQIILGVVRGKCLLRQTHSQSSLSKITQYLGQYEGSRLEEFLSGLTDRICRVLSFGTCSIFLKDSSERCLKLKALSGPGHRSKPAVDIKYPLEEDSLTARAFKARRILWAYETDEDSGNAADRFAEIEGTARNWISLPIFSRGEDGSVTLGLMRATNKSRASDCGSSSHETIGYFDFQALESICSNLASILLVEQKSSEVESRLERWNEVNRLFLHEIRTPISTISLAPRLIERTVQKNELDSYDIVRMRSSLEDIKSSAERLEFLTKIMSFEDILKERDFKEIDVVREVILPVVSMCETFFKKQYRIDVDAYIERQERCMVRSDKTLLSMVFQSLLYNAARYSHDPRKPVVIAGAPDDRLKQYEITVKSYSLPIMEDEAEHIFEMGYRGRASRSLRDHGIGLGLYVARVIMRELGGELRLTSLENPVTFSMRVPSN